jgi:hypothetical protein
MLVACALIYSKLYNLLKKNPPHQGGEGKQHYMYLLSLGVNRCFERQLSKEWSYHKSLWGSHEKERKRAYMNSLF